MAVPPELSPPRDGLAPALEPDDVAVGAGALLPALAPLLVELLALPPDAAGGV